MLMLRCRCRPLYVYLSGRYRRCCSLVLFFFQAEDGIRDIGVTWSSDVCSSDLFAKPDGSGSVVPNDPFLDSDRYRIVTANTRPGDQNPGSSEPVIVTELTTRITTLRSEERRVGKECRARWWADQ